jgi:hypothetical protein
MRSDEERNESIQGMWNKFASAEQGMPKRAMVCGF